MSQNIFAGLCVCVRLCKGVSREHSSCVCVCFYMCVWVWAMNVPCEGVWKRPDAGCQALLCLSSPSNLPPRSRPRWWMTANEKFPLLDCRLQPAAVRGPAICFPLQGPAGAFGLGLGFGYAGSSMGLERQPGVEAGWAELTNLWLTNEAKEIMFIFNKTENMVHQSGLTFVGNLLKFSL